MAPIRPVGKKPTLGNVLVIGGCGFLGHHIVAQIIENWGASRVSVIDLRTDRNRRPESDKVSYYDGDITKVDTLLEIFDKAKPDVVIHTASPLAVADASQKTKDLYYKVNVEGTKAVIEACQTKGVKVLVYTSSASVVSDNASDLINVDERWPVVPPKYQTEYYSQTKAEAESLVLAANRAAPTPSLLTTSIRPAGIFGEGDVQIIPNMYNAYKDGKTGFQLGNNKNLFDFTYVGNVAHAHLLAANALYQTSQMATAPLDHEKVDGEVFFITNDEPVPFWDFARGVWKAAGSTQGTENVWVIPKDVGIAIGGLLEWVMWGLGRSPKLTIRQVKFSCMTRYYDCKKAKQRLGYKPLVGLWEGIEKGVKWTMEQEAKGIELKK